jgi:hypothetical protein
MYIYFKVQEMFHVCWEVIQFPISVERFLNYVSKLKGYKIIISAERKSSF